MLVHQAPAPPPLDDPFTLHLPPAPSAPVQRRPEPAGGAASDEQVQTAATLGTSGPAGPLPHLDTIQRAFGHHDVSHVQAHTGAEASRGAAAMGAEAFATGDRVAFAGTPSLHTAAHEAAHVIQQQGGVQLAGGVGREGDRYERHADAVADRVVAGESAAGLLDELAGPSWAPPPIQRAPVTGGGPIQLAPEKDDERGEGKWVDRAFDPPLLLVATSTVNVFTIEHTKLTVHFHDSKYFRDAKHKQVFDVGKYRSTSIEEFSDWEQTFQTVTGEQAKGLGGLDLERAYGMHLCQMFFANAFFEAGEIERFDYQATPFNFTEGGGYLRSHASSFTTALVKSYGAYSPEELYALRNVDFRDVLGQMMDRVVLDGGDTTKEQIKLKLTATITRMAKYAVDRTSLNDYDRDNPVSFVDFSAMLDQLQEETDGSGIPVEGKKLAKLINDAALELAKDKLIDLWVDKHYTGEERAEAKTEIKQRLAGTKPLTITNLYAIIDHRKEAEFNKVKLDRDTELDTAKKELTTPSKERDDEALFKFYKGELEDYIKWLEANEGERREGSDEASLVALKLDRTPQKKQAFIKLIKVTDGSFSRYLTAKRSENALRTYTVQDTFAEKEVDNQLKPLKELLERFSKGLPTVMMSGGVMKLDEQPLLFTPAPEEGQTGPSPEMGKQVEMVLNKGGYNPTPTTAIKGMQGKGMSIKEIVVATLEQQLEHESRSQRVTDKLNRLLERIHGFDPSKYTSREAAVDELEQTRVLFGEFEKLGASDLDHVSLLAGSASKLVKELKLLEDDALPAPMLERLAFALQGALNSTGDVVRFTREIMKVHELILFALEKNPELGKGELELGVSKEDLQGARITDYGLKAFAEAYNAFLAQSGDKDSLKIDAYYNIYFELTHKLNTTRVSSGGKVTTTAPTTVEGTDYVQDHEEQLEAKKLVSEVAVSEGVRVEVPRPDLVLIDIHPNDAARPEMHKNDVVKLLTALFPEDKDNRCTVMVDVTLNYISEDEVEQIRQAGKPFIDSGRLNLVFVQSLTKFAQLGTDKLSGGLVVHYNKPEAWAKFNESMKKSAKEDVVDSTIERYFKALFKHTKHEQLEYIKKIRANTTYLYEALQKELAKLDVSEHAISLALNDDPGSCYVALHYEELAAKLFGKELTDDKVEKLNHAVLHDGILKLVEKLNLPLSMRQSFGFPMSNFGDTGKTIRLTLGVESKELLDQYVKVLTLVNGKLSSTDVETLKDSQKRTTLLDDLTKDIVDLTTLQDKLEPMFKKD